VVSRASAFRLAGVVLPLFDRRAADHHA